MKHMGRTFVVVGTAVVEAVHRPSGWGLVGSIGAVELVIVVVVVGHVPPCGLNHRLP